MQLTEHQEQVLIFKWAAMNERFYPQLAYMFSTLNGVRLRIGQAKKMKDAGNKRGVPDIILPYANDDYNGLFIELKVGKNKLSVEQKDYINYLRTQNYLAVCVYGYKNAITLIKRYITNN
jgi:hypothetical protein